MSLTRSPYREVVFLAGALALAAVWLGMAPATPKWAVLGVVCGAGLAVLVLLALAEVQESFEKLTGRRTEVKPDITVLDLVRVVVAGEGADGANR